MIRVEPREEGKGLHIVQVKDIKGIAYLILVDKSWVWLVNNRIDLTIWNELYA